MSSSVRTGKLAIAWAQGQRASGTSKWHNLCLKFVRSCFNVPAKNPNARLAWANAKKKHKTGNAASIPAGVPVYWDTRTTNDHIAISVGGGKCLSSDVGGKGKIGLIGIDALSKAWNAQLLGWSEDVNGVTVYTAPPKPAKVPGFPKGIAPDKSKPSARTLQKQLKKAGYMPKGTSENDNYGPATKAAVVKFHKDYPRFHRNGVSEDPAIGPSGWKFLFTNF